MKKTFNISKDPEPLYFNEELDRNRLHICKFNSYMNPEDFHETSCLITDHGKLDYESKWCDIPEIIKSIDINKLDYRSRLLFQKWVDSQPYENIKILFHKWMKNRRNHINQMDINYNANVAVETQILDNYFKVSLDKESKIYIRGDKHFNELEINCADTSQVLIHKDITADQLKICTWNSKSNSNTKYISNYHSRIPNINRYDKLNLNF